MSEETLIIGIGAQKAGTTWLSDYLRDRQPLVHVRPVKEVHFFDTCCLPSYGQYFEDMRLGWLKDRVGVLTRDSLADPSENTLLVAQVQRFAAIRSPEAYLAFLREGQGDARVLCDITPDYALLDAAGFQMIRKTHPRVKLVFILRNPAERFWSSLRFNHTHNPDFDIASNFDRMLGRDDFIRFANYERTIRCALEAFTADDLFVSFYENLFSDEEIRRLCDWVGLPFVPGDYAVASNAAVSGEMPEPLRQRAVLAYQRTYREMQARFGNLLPRSWQDDIARYF